MLAAARNTAGYAMVTLLFERRGHGFPITRKVRVLLFQIFTEDEAKHFISQYGDQLPLTKEVVTMVCHSGDLMVQLLDQSQDRSPITKRTMKFILEMFSGNGQVLTMLLGRYGDQIPVTEEIVKPLQRNMMDR
jgi:hypothetical protein